MRAERLGVVFAVLVLTTGCTSPTSVARAGPPLAERDAAGRLRHHRTERLAHTDATRLHGGNVVVQQAAYKGSLQIIPGGRYSPSELYAARALADAGRNVVLRPAVVARADGSGADLVVDGVFYDVYAPTTRDAEEILSNIRRRKARGIVLDLRQTPVKRAALGPVLERARRAGATSLLDVVILGGG